MKQAIIGAGFSLLGATGLHRLTPARLRGLGAILMFHHVRPSMRDGFRPNALLDITPEFLDALIGRLRDRGYDIVSLDEALTWLASHAAPPQRPFAVLTFDDGYRNNLENAVPVLTRHAAPYALYVTPGFADGTGHLWWSELEEAIRRTSRVEVTIGGVGFDLPSGSTQEKRAAFAEIYKRIRECSEAELLAAVARLCASSGVTGRDLTTSSCMTWDEIGALSREPLATIGAHTMTHPRLAKIPEVDMVEEMVRSREEIERRIGQPVKHIAYPVGDPTSAGPREFEAARRAGFTSAVTTRPGLIFAEHADHLTALPRLSVNGLWQTLDNIEVLLSGCAFALWNRGRRVNAA